MIDEWGKGAKYWDKPWNPVIGCKKVSEGCLNCYAERICQRFGQWKHRDFTPQPGNCKKLPHRGIIFAGNMTDLFGEWNTDAAICSFMARMAIAPKARYLMLTKRPKRAVKFIYNGWFKDHIWYGVTAETQARLEERCSDFHRYSVNKWISLEPLLERLDLTVLDNSNDRIIDHVDWVVVGAESGPNRRPCSLDWVRQIVSDCREAHVPVFVKQLDIGGELVKDIAKFPEDLQIRQVPWKTGRNNP